MKRIRQYILAPRSVAMRYGLKYILFQYTMRSKNGAQKFPLRFLCVRSIPFFALSLISFSSQLQAQDFKEDLNKFFTLFINHSKLECRMSSDVFEKVTDIKPMMHKE